MHSPNVGVSALNEQLCLPSQKDCTMASELGVLQVELTAKAPQPPDGVPYEAKVTCICAPGVAQNMEMGDTLMTSPQKGDETGMLPPSATVVLTSTSASAGAKEPAGGPARKESTSSFSAQ